MANTFKIYPINNDDKPGLFEFIFGKRRNSDIIKPIFVVGYEYRFLDKRQSILFHAKFHEKSKIDGLPYFIYGRVADYSLATNVQYVKADNGVFKIRRIETIKNEVTNL